MKRFMRLGTIAAASAAAIVAVAWIVKDRVTGPAPAPAGSGGAPRLSPAPAPAPAPAPRPKAKPAAKPSARPTAKAAAKPKGSAGDDLSEISGIGPVYKSRLAEAGITSFAGLAGADASKISGKIEAPVSRIQAWIDAARRRSA